MGLDGQGYATPARDSLGILPSDHLSQSARPAAGGTPGQLGSGVTYSGPSGRILRCAAGTKVPSCLPTRVRTGVRAEDNY